MLKANKPRRKSVTKRALAQTHTHAHTRTHTAANVVNKLDSSIGNTGQSEDKSFVKEVNI